MGNMEERPGRLRAGRVCLGLLVAVCAAAFAAPAEHTLRLRFVGDVMMHEGQIKSGLLPDRTEYRYETFFHAARPYLQDADLTIGNLEVTLIERNYTGYPCFGSPERLARALKWAGFDVLVTANNHCLDKFAFGVRNTLDVLDSRGLMHAGTARSPEEHDRLFLLERNGIRIALLAYTEMTNGVELSMDREQVAYFVNYMRPDTIKADIARARAEGAQAVIVFLHWGDEYQRKPASRMIGLADELAASDADLVIGCHPHVLQPAVWKSVTNPDGTIRRVLVAYSLGNFISAQRARYKDAGAILEVSLTRVENANRAVVADAELHPTWIHAFDSAGRYGFRTVVARDAARRYRAGTDPLLREAQYRRVLESIADIEELQSWAGADAVRITDGDTVPDAARATPRLFASGAGRLHCSEPVLEWAWDACADALADEAAAGESPERALSAAYPRLLMNGEPAGCERLLADFAEYVQSDAKPGAEYLSYWPLAANALWRFTGDEQFLDDVVEPGLDGWLARLTRHASASADQMTSGFLAQSFDVAEGLAGNAWRRAVLRWGRVQCLPEQAWRVAETRASAPCPEDILRALWERRRPAVFEPLAAWGSPPESALTFASMPRADEKAAQRARASSAHPTTYAHVLPPRIVHDLFGITPGEPGWTTLDFEPRLPAGIGFAQLLLPVPGGSITVEYAANAGYRLILPGGTRLNAEAVRRRFPVAVEWLPRDALRPHTPTEKSLFLDHAAELIAGASPMLWVSVDEQRMRLVRDGFVLWDAPCSTTPYRKGGAASVRGWYRVAEEYGEGVPPDIIFAGNRPTDRVWQPGDPAEGEVALGRVITLSAIDPARNPAGPAPAIHGTPHTAQLGRASAVSGIRLAGDAVATLSRCVKAGTLLLATTTP